MSRNQVTRIFEVLKEQGRSKEWFAREMGINRTHLYQINWGDRPTNPSFRKRSAELLGVEESYLFFLPETVGERTISSCLATTTEVSA